MRKYNSAFKLPFLNNRNHNQVPEESLIKNSETSRHKLKLLHRYQRSLSKSRTRTLSDVTIPTPSNTDNTLSKKRKSRMVMEEVLRKQHLDDQRKIISEMGKNMSQPYKQFRKRYYIPEKIKDALERIHVHKANIQQFTCMAFRKKALQMVKRSFYNKNISSTIILDQIYGARPVNYELARQVLITEQKLNQILLSYKSQKLDDVVQSIDKYEKNIKQLHEKVSLLKRNKTRKQRQQLCKSLQKSDVNSFLRGFKVQQQNMVQMSTRRQRQVGRLIKNGLILSESQMITRRYQLLKYGKFYTQPT